MSCWLCCSHCEHTAAAAAALLPIRVVDKITETQFSSCFQSALFFQVLGISSVFLMLGDKGRDYECDMHDVCSLSFYNACLSTYFCSQARLVHLCCLVASYDMLTWAVQEKMNARYTERNLHFKSTLISWIWDSRFYDEGGNHLNQEAKTMWCQKIWTGVRMYVCICRGDEIMINIWHRVKKKSSCH